MEGRGLQDSVGVYGTRTFGFGVLGLLLGLHTAETVNFWGLYVFVLFGECVY